MDALIQAMVEAGHETVGAPYLSYKGPGIEACAGGYMDCPEADAKYVKSHGAYCAGELNYIRKKAGLKPVGGTHQWMYFINPWEKFDPFKKYPVGTILIQSDEEGVSEGHVAMVSSEDQHVLQSNTYHEGVTDKVTVKDQNRYTPFDYAGYMPDALPEGIKKKLSDSELKELLSKLGKDATKKGARS